MHFRCVCILAVALSAACSGDSQVPTVPTAPPSAPAPAPAPNVNITGTITDTVTGHSVGSFTSTATSLPALVAASAPGYVTRETWARSTSPTVDLFPERGFDLRFYRQFARNDLERGSAALQPLRVLRQAPAFYMEVEGAKGLSAQIAARLERVARRVVPTLSGGRFQVAQWETGPTPRQPQAGWIMIEHRDDPTACGRAFVGISAGQIFLNGDPDCRIEATFAHEIGHAFGFWHVDTPGAMMSVSPDRWFRSAADAPNETERHHAALAYARQPGNADVDVDPQMPTMFDVRQMVR